MRLFPIHFTITGEKKIVCNTTDFVIQRFIYPFSRKTLFEACRVVFWSLSCCLGLKLTTKPFAGRTLRGLLIQMQKYQLAKFRHAQKAKLPFTFAFSSPLFFCFSCIIFFSFVGHLVRFILVGNVFRKAFRILGLGERKGRWVMEQDFHGDFQVNVTWFFAFFSSVLD